MASPIEPYRDSPVVVTGATGFIGGRLAEVLAEGGARVSRLPGRRESEAMMRRDEIGAWLRDARPAWIFHVAGETRPTATEAEYRAGNVTLTRALLDGAEGLGATLHRFVHVGTCAEYGTATSPLVEEGPATPEDAYGRSKLEATRMALARGKGGLPVTVVRPFLVYGPRQHADRLMPSLFKAVATGRRVELTRGEQTRDVIFVDDVVESLLILARHAAARGEVVNVGSGIGRSVQELARAVITAAGIAPERSPLHFGALPYPPGETMSFFADVTRMRELCGFTERTPFPEAVARTLAWYRSHAGEEA